MFLLEILKAILFGIVEGITEWLPISSTGHMIILDELVALNVSRDLYELFSVVIQIGAILAVVLTYWQHLCPIGRAREERRGIYRLWGLMMLGTLPSAAVGLFLDDLLDRYLYNYQTVALMLILWGVAFIAVERARRGKTPTLTDLSELSPRDALCVGLFQMFALIPGTSRSGATILGAYILGASRTTAAEFSFFLALPTMAGAGILKTAKYIVEGNSPSREELSLLLIGTATAFFVSLAVISFFSGLVKKKGFTGFGVYRIILGITAIIYFLIKG